MTLREAVLISEKTGHSKLRDSRGGLRCHFIFNNRMKVQVEFRETKVNGDGYP